MKERIIKAFRQAPEALCEVTRLHAVELLLVLHTFVVGCWHILCEQTLERDFAFSWWSQSAVFLPLFFSVAFALNGIFTERPKRALYWLTIVPYALLGLCPDLEGWVEQNTSQWVVSNLVLMPLVLLSFRRERENAKFVDDAFRMLNCLLVGLALVTTLFLLVAAIYASTTYIFRLETFSEVFSISALACYTLLLALTTLALWDKGQEQPSPSATATSLMNYIISPAIIIYSAILYLYAAMILLRWELPIGGVANMVFAYMIITALAKACTRYTTKQSYEWFYSRFSLIALPLLLLFWVGAINRVAEYGVTIWRFYMIVCGVIMTLYILLFLPHRKGRYLTLSLCALLLFSLSAYAPFISAKQTALRSQIARARDAAQQLGMLTAEGRLAPKEVDADDYQKRDTHRRLYQSLEYIYTEHRDKFSTLFGIGSTREYTSTLTPATERYATSHTLPTIEPLPKQRGIISTYYCYSHIRTQQIDTSPYRSFSLHTSLRLSRRWVTIGDKRYEHHQILELLFSAQGFSLQNPPSKEWIEDNATELLTLKLADRTIYLEDLIFTQSADNEWHIEQMSGCIELLHK